ncbi:MAG: hypothetical protein H7Y04_15730 [Verrucomicrobia bacterium]|nr:hypothetical protein [Cytophagales bacterium]
MKKILLTGLFFCFSAVLFAQTDTLKVAGIDTSALETMPTPQRVFSPRRATLYAAVFPGLGQIYNRQYWKVPIVWGGFGTLAFFILDNNRIYKKGVNDNFLLNNYPESFPADKLPGLKQRALFDIDTFRRYRDLSIILSGVAYLLVIADANVAAHLKNFDTEMKSKLSLQIRPSLVPLPVGLPAAGLSATLTIR